MILTREDYRRIKGYDRKALEQWIIHLYNGAYEEGRKKGIEEAQNGAGNTDKRSAR